MSVRAKFRCAGIVTGEEPGAPSDITLHAVYDEDPNSENRKYWETTPAGTITLSTVNEAAANEFEVGAEYYVDFTKAE